MLDTSVALSIIFGLMLIVVCGAVWCWFARVTSIEDSRSYRRFHRTEIAITAGACLAVLAALALTVSRM